jgi:hypothetical protein
VLVKLIAVNLTETLIVGLSYVMASSQAEYSLAGLFVLIMTRAHNYFNSDFSD